MGPPGIASVNHTTTTPHPTPPNMTENARIPLFVVAESLEDSEDALSTLRLWAYISQILWWTVLIVSLLSICILSHALHSMLTRYRRSMYYHFLCAMILLDLLMLVSIITNLMSDYFTLAAWLKGSAMCKLTAFLTNGEWG